tara:strand:- start:7971 stop:8744 length:774 start_codon:yes stop_codon:yes gene_type:complete
MKYLAPSALTISLLFPLLSQAATLTIPEAEYLTGSLCMLSQRMDKDYMAIGAGIRPDEAMKDLDESIATFEARFQTLLEYSENNASGKSIQAIGTAWEHYRNNIISPPSQAKAISIIKESEELLAICDSAVAFIAHQSNSPIAQLIEVSEHGTTLTQKIAKYYFALYWNVDGKTLKQDFDKSVKEFDDSLNSLTTSSSNTTEISAALAKVKSQWQFSNSGFKLDEQGHFVPTVISVTSESIFNKMSAVAIMYEKLAD